MMSRQGKASRLPVRAQWRRVTHEADVHSRSFRWRVPVYQLSTARSGDAGRRSGPCEFRRRGGHKGCSCTSGCAQDHASNGTPRISSPILSEPNECCASLTRRSVTLFAGSHARAGDVRDEQGLIGLRNIVGYVTRAASGSFSRGYTTKDLRRAARFSPPLVLLRGFAGDRLLRWFRCA
jgi:hypothetical protein